MYTNAYNMIIHNSQKVKQHKYPVDEGITKI